MPGYTAPPPAPISAPIPPFNAPVGPAASYNDFNMAGAPTGPTSKKRGHDQTEDVEFYLGGGAQSNNGRNFKQPRHSGNSAPGGQYASYGNYGQAPSLPQMMQGMPAFDPNDPMSAMAMMQAMGMQFPGMPPLNGGQTGRGPQQRRMPRCRDYDQKGFCARGNSCKFEHGTDSIYVPPGQGQNDEYDPANATLVLPPPPQNMYGNGQNVFDNSRGRGREGRGAFGGRGGASGSGRGGRSEFASDRPNFDKSRTTIVVEGIPEDKYNDESIRSFFSEFGDIVSVDKRTYRKVAIINFATWDAAQAAYNSPKVIFDNRFVKVYWYKDESTLPQPPAGRPTSQHASNNGSRRASLEQVDPEEFARKQAEAQAAHEEKMKKKREVEEQREAMQKRALELQKKQEEERKRLMEKLGSHVRKSATPGANQEDGAELSEAEKLRRKLAALEEETRRLSQAQPGPEDHVSPFPGRGRGRGGFRGRGAYSSHASNGPSTTITTTTQIKTHNDDGTPLSPAEALKAQLAQLEAEAKELGIDPDAEDYVAPWPTRGRGRGGRGRGCFVPRGRGAFRGRGGMAAPYNAYKLDNRPKKVGIAGVDLTDSAKDEALRSYLLVCFYFPLLISGLTPSNRSQGVGEYETLDTGSNKSSVLFKDRFTAEKFYYAISNNGSEIPGVGKVELSWIATPLPPVNLTPKTEDQDASSPSKMDTDEHGDRDVEGDAMADHERNGNEDGDERERDMDYENGEDWS